MTLKMSLGELKSILAIQQRPHARAIHRKTALSVRASLANPLAFYNTLRRQ